MNIIGLGYKASVGKDTVANYLKANYGFISMGFADSLKEAGYSVFALAPHIPREEKEKALEYWELSPREIWQRVGDAFKNEFGEDVWWRSLERRIQRYGHLWKNIVITDVRFRCELEGIKRIGGRVVRIDRSVAAPVRPHRSETELDTYDGWDAIIDNNGTLSDLTQEIRTKLVPA